MRLKSQHHPFSGTRPWTGETLVRLWLEGRFQEANHLRPGRLGRRNTVALVSVPIRNRIEGCTQLIEADQKFRHLRRVELVGQCSQPRLRDRVPRSKIASRLRYEFIEPHEAPCCAGVVQAG